jgi:uracil-DNA glycosylase family 4
MVKAAAKSKTLEVKTFKESFLDKLKLLTKTLIDTEINPKKLEKLTNNKSDNEKLKYRIYNHYLSQPKVIKYVNKYMNGLYDFHKFHIEDLIFTFNQLSKTFNIQSTKQLYFTKFKVDEYANFKKIIMKYYDEKGSAEPSNSEVAALYSLYSNNIITENDVENMKMMIEGRQKMSTEEKKLDDVLNIPKVKKTAEAPLSEAILNFNKTVKEYIKNRPICKNCPMYSKGSVIVDTNVNEPEEVDIAFIALNPGKDEYDKDKPLIGKSGQLFRTYLDKLVQQFNLKYVIYNSILCWSNNSKEIPNIKAVIKNCHELNEQIGNVFPAKLKVLVGADAMSGKLGINSGITKLNGTVQDGYYIMIHPSAVLRSPANMKYFEAAWKNLEEIFQKYSSKLERKSKANERIFTIPEDKIVKNVNENYTLFDIQIMNEKVIYILIDQNGEKKYLFGEQVQFPVYFKSGKYNDCKYIEDMGTIEAIAYLTKEEREQLNRKLYYNLKNIVN